jgi:hypothetical protein
VTAKARVLALPLLALGLVAVVVTVFYIRVSCTADGRESPGDKHEWSILETLEARHKDSAISDLEFSERDGYHILCVPGVGSGKRVWIMLDPRNPPFYKQLPHGDYSLSREQYERITVARNATSTVEESLSSHVR